ncbi:hypothetical protein [Gehongia tenuis]|uniref:Uncharacterized protein n=1 Tax=Gehongia tenuis TaxID=2763655 RepID=A0A926HPM1_9FIRM|nr:hypothetical protein [Gehongia tenuis]MBC8530331.1 hypothetical protein [Gehongia tenuis]
MRKWGKRAFWTGTALACLAVLYFGGQALLGLGGSAFRPWVSTAVIGLGVLLGCVFLVMLIVLTVKLVLEPLGRGGWRTVQRIVGPLAAAGLLWMMIFAGRAGLLGLVFSIKPEHVMDRDGARMVAVVNSFLEVTVNYHAYQNFLTMGKDVLIYEDYGNGGYDPFEEGRDAQPLRTLP